MMIADGDKNEIRELVEKTFPYENKGFYDFFFDKTVKEIECFYKKIDGKIASVLFSMPVVSKPDNQEGRYLYALATDPSFRGKGFITELIYEAEDAAKKSGASFFVLVPFEKSLFDFYEKRGYKPFCKKSILGFQSKSAPKLAPIEEISAEAYANIRRHFFQNKRAIVAKEGVEAILLENASFGFSFYKCGYSAFMLEVGDELFIAELLASKDEASLIADSIMAKFGASEISLPMCDAKSETNSAMIKGLDPEDTLFMTYILD